MGLEIANGEITNETMRDYRKAQLGPGRPEAETRKQRPLTKAPLPHAAAQLDPT